MIFSRISSRMWDWGLGCEVRAKLVSRGRGAFDVITPVFSHRDVLRFDLGICIRREHVFNPRLSIDKFLPCGLQLQLLVWITSHHHEQ